MSHLVQLIMVVPGASTLPLNSIGFLSPREKEDVTTGFSRSYVEIPEGKTIVDLFEAQAAATPDAVAVAFADRTLSYAQLDEQANRVGHYLKTTCGIGPDDLVAILLERSESMIVALLGIMKAGGAYV